MNFLYIFTYSDIIYIYEFSKIFFLLQTNYGSVLEIKLLYEVNVYINSSY